MPVLPQVFPRAAIAVSDVQQLARSATDMLRDSTTALLGRAIPLPSSSSPSSPTLLARQSQPGYILVIPTQYQGLNSGPAPGAVVGIILGSILGFLLIMWLLWILSNGGDCMTGGAYVGEEVEVVSRRRSITPPPPKSKSHRSRAATEKTSGRSPRRDRVIRTERIVRERDEYPPSLGSPPPRDRSRVRETIIVEPPSIRRVPGDDIVEVFEEHSEISLPPPRRAPSGRGSVYRSVHQDSEYYD